MKKTLILGFGITGKSVAAYFESQNLPFLVADKKSINIPQAIRDDVDIDFDEIEKIIVSPGINLTHPLLIKAKKADVKIYSEIEFAVSQLINPMIGITGTNGKTTLTLLLTHLFNRANIPAKALGNVGISLTTYLSNIRNDDVLFIELSSFQLELLTKPFLDMAVITNLSDDHLDRYQNLHEYIQAKANIQYCLKDSGKLIMDEATYEIFSKDVPKKRVLFVNESIANAHLDFKELSQKSLIGQSLLEIAYCVSLFYDLSKEVFISAVLTFKKPRHRLEYVDTIQSKAFYNDSKATNIASVVYAVSQIDKKIVLIAGGEDKKFDFTTFNLFKDKVTYIIAIGKTAKKIASQVNAIPVIEEETMQSAISKAFEMAKINEIILLSPGCSSYDMFNNYEHRGESFCEAVRQLKHEVQNNG